MSGSLRTAGCTVAALGLLATTPAMATDDGPARRLAAPAPVTITALQPTGLERIAAVSRTGRYVVGWDGTSPLRWQLRDLRTGSRIALLPKKAENPSISDNGRYVTYSIPLNDFRRHKVMRYDRRTDRKRQVTRKSNGRILTPKWEGTCTQASCEEDQKLVDSPQLVGGQISGNGRYTAFCANYLRPARVDLYLKNLRTEKLRRFNGACEIRREEGDTEIVQPPTVSVDARTIVLPGFMDAYEAYTSWGPGKALIGRNLLREIGGVGNSMTEDGQTITINGPYSATEEETAPADVVWYDVATGTRTPATPPGLRMNLQNSSDDGRYVLWRDSSTEPVMIRDRILGVDYDVQSPLEAAGYVVSPQVGRNLSWFYGFTDADSGISGTGRFVFIGTDSEVIRVRWAA